VNRNTDRIVEQAIAHELKTSQRPPSVDCIDAETLAAWIDQGLDDQATLAVEAHASNCARCQAMIAAAVRTAPVTVHEPRPFRVPAWWYPLAAGAAAVIIWLVVPDQRDHQLTPSDARPTAAAPTAPSPSAPSAEPPAAPAAAGRAQLEVGDRVAARAREDRAERKAIDQAKKEEAAETFSEAAAPQAPDAPAQIGAVAAAAPAVAAESPATLRRSARQATDVVEVSSPQGAVRWRLGTAAGLERSDDAGASWRAIRQIAGESLVAGVALSPAVAWFVGRDGVVLLTTDGVTFTRVDLPDSVDAVSVTATDGRNAVVTTVDGRRFRTGDAGRTWQVN